MNSFTSFAITFGLVVGLLLAEAGARRIWQRCGQSAARKHRYVTRGALCALLPAVVLAFVSGHLLGGRLSDALFGTSTPGMVLCLIFVFGGVVTAGAALGCALSGKKGGGSNDAGLSGT